MDKNTLLELGLNPPNIISGALGGVVSALAIRNVSPFGVFTSVVAGGALSNYGADYGAKFIGISVGLSGCLIGITALVLVQLILEGAKNVRLPFPGAAAGPSDEKKP